MRVRSRFFTRILFVALVTSVCGVRLSSSYCTHAAGSVRAVLQQEERLPSPIGQTNQEKTQVVIPPLPDEVLSTDLTALDGSKFNLADYRGRVILVNLWATWCGPCRSDIPHLIEISQEFSARGVEVVGLTNEDPETDADKVQDFVDDFKINYKIGWSDQSFVVALMQGNIRNNIPQSFVISRDGRVLTRFIGFSQTDTPPKMRQAIENALNEK